MAWRQCIQMFMCVNAGVLFESRCTAVLACLHWESYSAALTNLAEGEGEHKLSWHCKGGHVRKE